MSDTGPKHMMIANTKDFMNWGYRFRIGKSVDFENRYYVKNEFCIGTWEDNLTIASVSRYIDMGSAHRYIG
jgi:hypothetical protein